MRHEAAGITTQAFPKHIRLGGTDCQATYLHEPGDARDGVTVTVPLFVLNQVSEDRCEWLVPGLLKDKIQALLKSLPQRPRSRFEPLPESATRLAAELSAPELFGAGSLTDVLLKKARDETSLDIKRTDFKHEMLSPHLFMNLLVVDEHGRQLGMGRNLGALKGELGAKARGAFQALAQLKVAASPQADGHPIKSGVTNVHASRPYLSYPRMRVSMAGEGSQASSGCQTKRSGALKHRKRLLVARPMAHRPRRLATSRPIWVMPLRETTTGTPICADLMTISLVKRPVV
jgi:ATP-dependent helicase HrpA